MKRAEFERVWAGPVPADKLCPPQQAEVDAAATLHHCPLHGLRVAANVALLPVRIWGRGGQQPALNTYHKRITVWYFQAEKKKKKN